MSWCIPPWVYFIWYSLCFLDFSDWFLFHVREVFGYYLLEYFFCLLLSSPSGTPIIWTLVRLMLSQSSLRLSLFLFSLFALFCSTPVISSNLSSTLLIRSSASCILLLAASSEFFLFQLLYFASLLL